MDNLQTLIGERIAKQRKQLRISQTELAEQLGKSLRTVQKYESGEIDMSVSVLEQIANILKMPINYLMGYDSSHIKLETLADVYAYLFELDRKKELKFDIDFIKGPESVRKVVFSFDISAAELNPNFYNMMDKFHTQRDALETYWIDYNMYRDWEEKEIQKNTSVFLSDKEYEILDHETRMKLFNEIYMERNGKQTTNDDTEQ